MPCMFPGSFFKRMYILESLNTCPSYGCLVMCFYTSGQTNVNIPQLGLPIRGSNWIPKQPVASSGAGPPRVPRGLLIWPGSPRIQSLVPQPPNVQNVQNVWQNPKKIVSRSKNPKKNVSRCARSQMSNMLNVKCQEC